MKRLHRGRAWWLIGLTLVVAAVGRAQTPVPDVEACADRDPLRRPFFGDIHVHTAYSFDASTQDTRNTPADAYRFAKGEKMRIQPYDEAGRPMRQVQLERPLDFAVVTDHAELLGETHICLTPGVPGYGSLICRIHRNLPGLAMQLISGRTMVMKSRWGICGDDGAFCHEKARNIWQAIRDAAEDAQDRTPACRFTSFVGYEWTATVGTGGNLHRNVVFKSARVPDLPVSWVETPSAAHLWDELETRCIEGLAGCDALTIPHNSNLSRGRIFATPALETPDDVDQPIDAALARRRARFEPLVEMMQHKGDSECSAEWATSDEACGFEALPYDSFGAKFSFLVPKQAPTRNMFVRDALLQGLLQQEELGANSLKFGVIASTDTHIAAPGLTREKDHPGHGGAGMGANEIQAMGFPDDLEYNPGGLAVVYAEENSRAALFDAMRRRETYGTSGTRPTVRFFGGFDYPADVCSRSDLVATGYAGGVPMGGDLDSAAARKRGAPRFIVSALRDPGTPDTPGTPLQRIQIIKGWVEEGEVRERVIDVAGGANQASVDLRTCAPLGTGHDSLCTRWVDDDFDPDAPAFYYARVLENPTCRWSQYVCNDAGVDCSDPATVPSGLLGCCSEEHRPVIQERAWTSPMWYTPAASP